jgi:deoxyadenosine/deoxycytidine kinase
VFFLNTRIRQVVEIRKKKKHVIQDRSIFEDAYIFAPNLHDMGLMASRDFENYISLFNLVSSFVQPADLVIYLKADTSTLVNQIQKRGRKYESSIRLDYLQSLNERYDKWAESYNLGKILVIDVDTCKFFDNAEDLGYVVDKVNAELFGLFPKNEELMKN